MHRRFASAWIIGVFILFPGCYYSETSHCDPNPFQFDRDVVEGEAVFSVVKVNDANVDSRLANLLYEVEDTNADMTHGREARVYGSFADAARNSTSDYVYYVDKNGEADRLDLGDELHIRNANMNGMVLWDRDGTFLGTSGLCL